MRLNEGGEEIKLCAVVILVRKPEGTGGISSYKLPRINMATSRTGNNRARGITVSCCLFPALTSV